MNKTKKAYVYKLINGIKVVVNIITAKKEKSIIDYMVSKKLLAENGYSYSLKAIPFYDQTSNLKMINIG